jgi:hypothetical protein
MRKTIAIAVAASFLGTAAVAVAPVPASAFIPLLFVPVMMAKEDKNFKAVNPYAPVKMHKAKKKKKM